MREGGKGGRKREGGWSKERERKGEKGGGR